MLEDATQRRSSCRRKEINLYSCAQMVQLSWQEKVKKSENPSSTRDLPNQCEHHRDDLQGDADRSDPVDQRLRKDNEAKNSFFVVFLGLIFYRHHVHTTGQSHSSMLTLSGGRIRHGMYCWTIDLKTVGTMMVTGSYRGHGPVTPSSQC